MRLGGIKKRRDEWNGYWSDRDAAADKFYDFGATIYRKLFIKPPLNHVIRKQFPDHARLLHAGSGSGMVDDDLHGFVDITALDHSTPAANHYRARHAGARATVGDIFSLPFSDGTFDGIYHLGLMEHYLDDEHSLVMKEFARVLKPGGKMVMFWPPRFGISVIGLAIIHWVLNSVLKKDVRLHPPEPSLIKSKRWIIDWIKTKEYRLVEYSFGPRDMFTQCVVVVEPTSDNPGH